MKKNIVFIIVFIMSILAYSNVNAVTYARVTNDDPSTWSGPGYNYTASKDIKYNDVIPLLNVSPLSSEKECINGFYKADINGQVKYICSDDVSTSNITVKTNTAGTNVRTGPGTNYDLYKSVHKGKLFTLDDTKKYEGQGCDEGWYKINYNTDSEKYICSKYVDNYNDRTRAVIMNTEGTKIKSNPTSESNTVATIKYGQAVTVYETDSYKGDGCDEGWLRIFYRGYTRYICKSDVTTNRYVYRVNNLNGLNIRSEANTKSAKITTLPYMTPVILATTVKTTGSGCENWYKIKINNKIGYVCSQYLSPAKNTSITTSSTNVRSKTSFDNTPITTLKKNDSIIFENITKVKGTGCDYWYKIAINGKSAYLCKKNTEIGNKALASIASSKKINSVKIANQRYYYTTNMWTYRLKENYGNVRTKASTDSSIQNRVFLGTEFEVIGSATGNSGCSVGWYKVKYYNNITGYICKSLVEKYSDVTKTDKEYCNTLKEAGFPSSYCPFLSYLHSKYPKWIFKAENTGVKFTDAVDNEEYKNLIEMSTKYMEYLKSSSCGHDGCPWRTASDALVAYMLDPRNYLNEQNIFAFENLSYDSKYHTKSAIKSIVSGTYLDNDTYAGYFLDAAKLYKVSPVHLAARVKQEGGTNQNYDSVSGKVTTTIRTTNSGYVCTAFGKKDGNYFKINSGSIANVRANANIDAKSLKYSNGNKMTVNKNDTLTLVSTLKYNGLATNTVNVREKTNTSSKKLGSLTKDTPVSLVSKEIIKGSNCTDGWYKINYKSGTGYVCSSYINPEVGCKSGEWYNVKVDKSLKSIYNFYNIGATGDSPILNGLKTAAGIIGYEDGTPWNTRAKAIKYGASFIANGYINEGQDTLYYQKFNTGPNATATRYTHQYMENIMAPAGESLSTYETYSKLKLLNKAYVFKIPVYNSMPTQFTTHPPIK